MGKDIASGTMEIRHLTAVDSAVLSSMLTSNSSRYQQYFRPFSFDQVSLEKILRNAKRDRYWGVWVGNELAGFFMLRGFDEGFEIPSYGVNISERYAGRRIGLLTLHYVISWCAIHNVNTIMLKVHPENTVAKRQYESVGFSLTGKDPKNGNLVYHFTLKEKRARG